MKYLFLIALLMISTVVLSACHGSASADLDDDRYTVDLDGDDRYDGDRNFCPPGHAKKGWC